MLHSVKLITKPLLGNAGGCERIPKPVSIPLRPDKLGFGNERRNLLQFFDEKPF